MSTPSKLKTWIGLAGALLSTLVPLVLSVQQYLPPQWAAVIGAVIALLTALGIYHAPYTPAGTVAAPDVAPAPPPPPGQDYRNPWGTG